MLVPGMVYNVAGSVTVTTGAAITPDFINQGFGFMNNGSLALDLDPPVGDFYVKGFRVSAAGAIYALQIPSTGGFHEGIYRNEDGRLVYDVANPVTFTSRNPISVNDLFAVA